MHENRRAKINRRTFLRRSATLGLACGATYLLETAGLFARSAYASPYPAPPTPISADSPILAPPSATGEQAIAYILARGSVYVPFDVGVIVGYYWQFAPAVGVDPLLAMAQCILETSQVQPDGSRWPLSSWWAQRPRRNPAGLGVTGATSSSPPQSNLDQWTWDPDMGIWRAGISFASWEESTQAQIGHLLAYALRDEEMTPEQFAMSRKSPRLHLLPDSYRGSARTLRGLNGRWAVPGTTYADSIADIARRIADVQLPR